MLLPIGFVLILITGLVSHFIAPDKAASEMENRMLQKAPLTPTMDELLSGQWSSQVEDYFSDQFPKRTMWTKSFVKSQMLLNKTYINEKYYVDEESGWITSKPAELQDEIGLKQITDSVASLNDVVSSKGIPFTFYSLPAKATYIRTPHPSYMPEDNGLVNNRNFLQYLTEKDVDNVRLMDVMLQLNEEKEEVSDWYFKTDHHWNMNGAFLGYEAIISDVAAKTGVAMEPLNVEEIQTECLDRAFVGSWNKFFNMLIPTDDVICYKEPSNFGERFTISIGSSKDGEVVAKDEIYATVKKSLPNTAVNFSTGYSSDFGELNITNQHKEVEGHLLVLKDSYFNPIQFLIANHFKNTTIIDLRYFEGDLSTYIVELNPTYVIMTYNDRNFDLGMSKIESKN